MKRHLPQVTRVFNETVPHSSLRLHSSERIYDFPNTIWNEFIASLSQSDIRYYPNLNEINEVVSNFFGLSSAQLIIASGSDRCIKYFFEAYVSSDTEVLLSDPCFPMYDVYTGLFQGVPVKFSYVTDRFSIESLLSYVIDNSFKNLVVILSNPLTPIGDAVSRADLLRLLETNVPVLIDEAYIEFSREDSLLDLLEKYKNLTVTRTFSKAFGSAGVRMGILASCEDSIANYSKLRDMYEISGPTARWIQTLVKYRDDLNCYIQETIDCRNNMVELIESQGFHVLNSEANWLHIKEPNDFLSFSPSNVIVKYGCKLPFESAASWMRMSVSAGMEKDPRFEGWFEKLVNSV